MSDDMNAYWVEISVPCLIYQARTIKAFYMKWLADRDMLATIGERKTKFLHREIVVRVNTYGDSIEDLVAKANALQHSMRDYRAFLEERGLVNPKK
jgi:hypothetical protein